VRNRESNVVALGSARLQKNRVSRKETMDPLDRIRDLESDLERAVQLLGDVEGRLYRQERYLTKLVRLLQGKQH
jgi:hypothetical protein